MHVNLPDEALAVLKLGSNCPLSRNCLNPLLDLSDRRPLPAWTSHYHNERHHVRLNLWMRMKLCLRVKRR